MNEHEVMKKAFSELHASDDTLQKVLQKTHAPKRIAPRRIAILVAAVVAICSLALVVQGTVFVLLGNHLAILNPAENPGTFIEDVYDVTLTPAPEMLDNHGNPIPMPDENVSDDDTHRAVAKIVDMYDLTLDGLERGFRFLLSGKK